MYKAVRIESRRRSLEQGLPTPGPCPAARPQPVWNQGTEMVGEHACVLACEAAFGKHPFSPPYCRHQSTKPERLEAAALEQLLEKEDKVKSNTTHSVR